MGSLVSVIHSYNKELHAAGPIAFWDKGAIHDPSFLQDLNESLELI